jgi:hypothetical protein
MYCAALLFHGKEGSRVSVEEKVTVVVLTEVNGCEFIEIRVDSRDEIICPCPTDLVVATE